MVVFFWEINSGFLALYSPEKANVGDHTVYSELKHNMEVRLMTFTL